MKAFPTLADNGHITTQDGMDMIDFFAAAALQGMCANPDANFVNATSRSLAAMAYSHAEAMMKARKDD